MKPVGLIPRDPRHGRASLPWWGVAWSPRWAVTLPTGFDSPALQCNSNDNARRFRRALRQSRLSPTAILLRPARRGNGQFSVCKGRVMDLLELALSYWRLGWSIIPIEAGTKKPRRGLSWKPFQTTRADERQLAEWCSKYIDLGLAVIFGEVSGGLICRDFDSMAAYNAWAARYSKLAAELPTVATERPGGGRHVYCRGNVGQIQATSKTGKSIIVYRDGELRGGGYCL